MRDVQIVDKKELKEKMENGDDSHMYLYQDKDTTKWVAVKGFVGNGMRMFQTKGQAMRWLED